MYSVDLTELFFSLFMGKFDRGGRSASRGPKGFGGKKRGGDKKEEWSFKKPGYPKADRAARPERGSFASDRAPARSMPLHDAVCNQCGNDCQVPFRPNGRKPVLCNTCFGKQEANGGVAPRSFDRPRFSDRAPRASVAGGEKISANLKQQLDDINAKLAQILKMLEEQA